MDDNRLCKRREATGFIGEELLSIRILSVTISCWGRKYLDTTPRSRWERPFARAAYAFLLSEESWENRFIVLRNLAFKDSEEISVRHI